MAEINTIRGFRWLMAANEAAHAVEQWSQDVLTELKAIHREDCGHFDQRCAIDMFGYDAAMSAALEFMRMRIDNFSRAGTDAWCLAVTMAPETMANMIYDSGWWEETAARISAEKLDRRKEERAREATFTVMVSGTGEPDGGREFAISLMKGNAKARGLELDLSTVRRSKVRGITGGYYWRAKAKPYTPGQTRRARRRRWIKGS